MQAGIQRLRVSNFRALAELELELHPLNVLFGPNGSGKSTLLDTLWFLRDCAVRGVEVASAERSHGIGMLSAAAPEGAAIGISIDDGQVEYELTCGLSSGRIEPFAGERLISKIDQRPLIQRTSGADRAVFHHQAWDAAEVVLREPQKLSLERYLDSADAASEAVGLGQLLRAVHYYNSRAFDLYGIKRRGSEAGTDWYLSTRGQNLWTVLRNLEGRRALDERYETILGYLRRALPEVESVVIEPTGPNTLYGSFMEGGLEEPILASGVSDGHLQMLLLLTALFAEPRGRASMVLLDEPEISLHPWALSVLAEALREATDEWGRQVVLATHSPVLISQFEPPDILVSQRGNARVSMSWLNEVAGIGELLEEYAAGSLYMANLVASQGVLDLEGEEPAA